MPKHTICGNSTSAGTFPSSSLTWISVSRDREFFERLVGTGFDSYEIIYDRDSEPHQEGSRTLCERMIHRKERCFLPWKTMVVGWDGQILPCFAERYTFDLGSAIGSDLSAAWTGQNYQNLRQGPSTLDPCHLHRNCHHCLHGEWPSDKPGNN